MFERTLDIISLFVFSNTINLFPSCCFLCVVFFFFFFWGGGGGDRGGGGRGGGRGGEGGSSPDGNVRKMKLFHTDCSDLKNKH